MRQVLPARRHSVTQTIEHEGVRFDVTFGEYEPGGHVGECFCSTSKSGSQMEGVLTDACILLSRSVQDGYAWDDLVGRLSHASGMPTSIIGRIAHAAAEIGR